VAAHAVISADSWRFGAGVDRRRSARPKAKDCAIPAKLVLRLVGALAPGLILVAVIHALLTAQFASRSAGRLVFLLALNTLVAIGIGLSVANLVRPGAWTTLPPVPPKRDAAAAGGPDVLGQFFGKCTAEFARAVD
jgi:DAACS family dicarboxylate/amino acid:cation (Na+ or H+) symporter